ncbi:hypothetical protein BD410DRAFT_780660 [Rickenella mellea]|uniref:Uncharacterized protein n=1 Tax=Rickenella mellea TaxID=50990 RepID=A0A4R5XG24_9AGAM|nr:hypothetical protein BD410DRAFT_780660 [Rickenella mellea]
MKICSLTGLWCVMFALVSMSWAIRSNTIAASVTTVFCVCLGWALGQNLIRIGRRIVVREIRSLTQQLNSQNVLI